MIKKLILLNSFLILGFIFPDQVLAQASWTETYGGSESDYGYAVQQTTDGGYIVAGYTFSFGAGFYDAWLIKTDAAGDTLWTKTYGDSTDSDYGYSVQQTNDGGFILTGLTYSFDVDSGDVWLIKTDETGDTSWTKSYGGVHRDYGYSVQQTADGGYILAGSTVSFGAGDYDVWLIKTNAYGDTVWTRTFGGIQRDYGYSVQQAKDGGYVLAGGTASSGAGGFDAWLIKTDEFGDTLWTRCYGGGLSEFGNAVQQTADGGFVSAGYTYSFGAGVYDIWLIKTNDAGDTLWTKTYGGFDWDLGYSVQQTSDGGYILAGYTGSFGAGGYDIWLIKTDELGDTLWTKTMGADGGEIGNSVKQTTDGGYVLAGYTDSFGAGRSDVWLIKTDSLGNTTIPKSEDCVVIDIGQVHNYVSNSTRTYASGEDLQTFFIGRDDLTQPSMMWLEGGYPVNHYLYYGTFRIGYNNDFIRFSYLTSNDWAVYRDDPTQVSPFDVHFSMTDSLADTLKVGVKCLCQVHAWPEPARDDFLIYEYFIINNSGGTLSEVYAGFHADGDISSASGGTGDLAYSIDDLVGFYMGTDLNGHPESISYMYDGDSPNHPGDDTGGRYFPKESLGYLGSRVLNCPAVVYSIPANQQSGHQWWDWSSDPQSGAEWYNYMLKKEFRLDPSSCFDYRYFQSMGPWNIPAGDTVRIALAFGIGDSLDGLRENLQTAYDLYWSEIITSAKGQLSDAKIPLRFDLKQNYPNPFNPGTTIEFSIPKTGFVSLKVYNILGQQVAMVVSEKLSAGAYKYEWQANNMPSGVYYCRLQAGEFEQVRKMLLLK